MEFSPSKGIQVEEEGMKYVDRGDPADYDFILTDLVKDDAWHDLDLSGIVSPAGAGHLIHLFLAVKATKGDNTLCLREVGNVNEVNQVCSRTQSANIANNDDCLVLADVDRKIQYKATENDWTGILISVRGWFEG